MADVIAHSFLENIVSRYFIGEVSTIKIALMNDTFVFDQLLHNTWADVSANEIVAQNGYVAGGTPLLNPVLDQALLDTENVAQIQWDNPFWQAEGGSIGPAGSAIVYQNDPGGMIFAHYGFAAPVTAPDGIELAILNPIIRLF